VKGGGAAEESAPSSPRAPPFASSSGVIGEFL
jgi:hypothetical protein